MDGLYTLIGILAASFFSSLAVYGAIRADLAKAISKAESAEAMAMEARREIFQIWLKQIHQ